MERQMKRAGFTLVELVVTTATVGLLSAIAIPRLIDLRAEAYNTHRDGIVGAARSGIMTAASKNQASQVAPSEVFPPNLEASWVGIPGGSQPALFPTACSAANPCFELVLSTPVTDGNWSQESATSYKFTPPVGTAKTYTYTASNGTLN